MDHKRGHGTSDQAQESTRVKRHKDLSYQQPSIVLVPSTNIGERYFPKPVVTGRHNSKEFDTRDKAQLASLERLRAIADTTDKCVDKLCGCHLQSNIEKSVEEVIYEEYLPIVVSQIAARSEQSSKLPILLTDRNAEIKCAFCPNGKRFKGWEALLIHAAKFQKGNNHQHRGYYRAVREALRRCTDEPLPALDIDPAPTSPKTAAFRDSEGQWQQPVVLVDKPAPEKAPPWSSRDPELQEVLAVYKTGRNKNKKKVVVVPASEVGFISDEILEKQCITSPGSKQEDASRAKFLNGRWPRAKLCQYVGKKRGDDDEDDRWYDRQRYPLSNQLTRALQIGRPKSPREKIYQALEERENAIDAKEELRLNKPLEEHRHIFDERQFDSKVNSLVKRWKDNFKGFDKANQRRSIMVAERESAARFFSMRGPMKELEKDEKFKDQVDQYALLNPSCRTHVKKQLSVLEEQLHKDRLLWLQDVETVRQQFQHLADAVHDEQVDRDAAAMRIEKRLDERMKNIDEQQQRKREYYMARKVISLHSCKRMRRNADMKGLMDLWQDEQRIFEKECIYARSEKEKLENLHMKIHLKAGAARKNQCPICLETLSWPLKVNSSELESLEGYGIGLQDFNYEEAHF